MNPIAFVAAAIAIHVAPAEAMQFHAAPPFLHVSGRVVSDDWQVWNSAMRNFEGQLKVVVFHDSPGGDSLAGRRIGESIRVRGMRTVVAGRCVSACANMFLGGVERTFASTLRERPTVLGFHGRYSRRSGAVEWEGDPGYYVEMTAGKMGEEFVRSFARLENQQGALYFIHPSQRESQDKALAYLCKGTERHSARDKECESLAQVDALEKGIVTTWDAVVVPPIPPAATDPPPRKNW